MYMCRNRYRRENKRKYIAICDRRIRRQHKTTEKIIEQEAHLECILKKTFERISRKKKDEQRNGSEEKTHVILRVMNLIWKKWTTQYNNTFREWIGLNTGGKNVGADRQARFFLRSVKEEEKEKWKIHIPTNHILNRGEWWTMKDTITGQAEKKSKNSRIKKTRDLQTNISEIKKDKRKIWAGWPCCGKKKKRRNN